MSESAIPTVKLSFRGRAAPASRSEEMKPGQLISEIFASQAAALAGAHFAVADACARSAAESIRRVQEEAVMAANRAIVESVRQQKRQYDQFIADMLQVGEVLSEEYRGFAPEYERVMAEAGWPPLDDLPIAAVKDIVQIYEKEGLDALRAQLDRELISFYDQDALLDIQARWLRIPFLKEHAGELEEIIRNHIAGGYAGAITLALSKVEVVVVLGSSFSGGYFGQNEFLRRYERIILQTQTEQGARAMVAYFRDSVYTNFYHGDRIPSGISRHAILHGAATGYGTEINSLKCILVLDHIIAKAQRYRRKHAS